MIIIQCIIIRMVAQPVLVLFALSGLHIEEVMIIIQCIIIRMVAQPVLVLFTLSGIY